MTTALATTQVSLPEAIENLLIRGDLSQLGPQDRISYYKKVCDLVGLNYTTQPFEYITLNGKLVLYAKKGAAEQIRDNKKMSIRITDRTTIEGVYIVTAAAQTPDGRTDESTGAVTITGLKGESLANAMMKAETKAKRRVTLSMSGLNMLDESEVKDIAPPRIGPGKWEPGNAVASLGRAAVIDSGTNARKHVGELSLEELKTKRRILEEKDILSIDERQTLDQVVGMIETLENLEPEFDEPKADPTLCKCGSGLKYSDRKGVYYCPNFNDGKEHIRPVQKAEYEALEAVS